VLPDRPASFATVVAAARDRSECAIGYRCHDSVGAPGGHGVRLNPAKSGRRVWSRTDEIVVIVRDGAAEDGAGGAGGSDGSHVARVDAS
jgi:hypothetical protein